MLKTLPGHPGSGSQNYHGSHDLDSAIGHGKEKRVISRISKGHAVMIWKQPLGFSVGMILLGGAGLITILIGCFWLLSRLSFRSRARPLTDSVRVEDGTSDPLSGRDGAVGGAESQTTDATGQPRTSPTNETPSFVASPLGASVQTLPLLRFSRCVVEGSLTWDLMGPMSECPVCLGEYEEGEIVRFLPNCKHIFHPECITAWIDEASPLSSSCPLCRTDVKVKKLSQLERMLSLLSTPNHGCTTQVQHSKPADDCGRSGPASAEAQPVDLFTSLDSNYDCRLIHLGTTGIIAPIWGFYVLQGPQYTSRCRASNGQYKVEARSVT